MHVGLSVLTARRDPRREHILVGRVTKGSKQYASKVVPAADRATGSAAGTECGVTRP